jgi:DHA1 family tetracycline resistance protein-like MFS transporter
MIANNVLPTIVVFYALNRYGFTLHDLAWMLGGLGLGSAIVGGFLTGPAVRWLGEQRALILGLVCGVAAFAMMGLSRTGALFLAAVPLICLKGLADAALTALMTRRVLPSEQGQLQGANSSLLGIAGLIGPAVYTESYAYFAAPHHGWLVPGAPFLIAGALQIVAISAAWLAGGGGGASRLEKAAPAL